MDPFKNAEMRLADQLVLLDEVDSTNEYCKSDNIKCDTVVKAKKQLSGRGRMGRKFYSDRGGFYISYCFVPKQKIPAERFLPITGICASVVLDAIKDTCKIQPKIKWTNDILLGEKKICGILTESVISGGGDMEKLIVGIGINTNQGQEAFSEIENIASSIYAVNGEKVNEDRLLLRLSAGIFDAYDALCRGDKGLVEYHVENYRANCLTLHREVSVLSPQLCEGEDPRVVFAKDPQRFPTARAIDIDEKFGLIIESPHGQKETLTFGEVSVR